MGGILKLSLHVLVPTHFKTTLNSRPMPVIYNNFDLFRFTSLVSRLPHFGT